MEAKGAEAEAARAESKGAAGRARRDKFATQQRLATALSATNASLDYVKRGEARAARAAPAASGASASDWKPFTRMRIEEDVRRRFAPPPLPLDQRAAVRGLSATVPLRSRGAREASPLSRSEESKSDAMQRLEEFRAQRLARHNAAVQEWRDQHAAIHRELEVSVEALCRRFKQHQLDIARSLDERLDALRGDELEQMSEDAIQQSMADAAQLMEAQRAAVDEFERDILAVEDRRKQLLETRLHATIAALRDIGHAPPAAIERLLRDDTASVNVLLTRNRAACADLVVRMRADCEQRMVSLRARWEETRRLAAALRHRRALDQLRATLAEERFEHPPSRLKLCADMQRTHARLRDEALATLRALLALEPATIAPPAVAQLSETLRRLRVESDDATVQCMRALREAEESVQGEVAALRAAAQKRLTEIGSQSAEQIEADLVASCDEFETQRRRRAEATLAAIDARLQSQDALFYGRLEGAMQLMRSLATALERYRRDAVELHSNVAEALNYRRDVYSDEIDSLEKKLSAVVAELRVAPSDAALAAATEAARAIVGEMGELESAHRRFHAESSALAAAHVPRVRALHEAAEDAVAPLLGLESRRAEQVREAARRDKEAKEAEAAAAAAAESERQPKGSKAKAAKEEKKDKEKKDKKDKKNDARVAEEPTQPQQQPPPPTVTVAGREFAERESLAALAQRLTEQKPLPDEEREDGAQTPEPTQQPAQQQPSAQPQQPTPSPPTAQQPESKQSDAAPQPESQPPSSPPPPPAVDLSALARPDGSPLVSVVAFEPSAIAEAAAAIRTRFLAFIAQRQAAEEKVASELSEARKLALSKEIDVTLRRHRPRFARIEADVVDTRQAELEGESKKLARLEQRFAAAIAQHRAEFDRAVAAADVKLAALRTQLETARAGIASLSDLSSVEGALRRAKAALMAAGDAHRADRAALHKALEELPRLCGAMLEAFVAAAGGAAAAYVAEVRPRLDSLAAKQHEATAAEQAAAEGLDARAKQALELGELETELRARHDVLCVELCAGQVFGEPKRLLTARVREEFAECERMHSQIEIALARLSALRDAPWKFEEDDAAAPSALVLSAFDELRQLLFVRACHLDAIEPSNAAQITMRRVVATAAEAKRSAPPPAAAGKAKGAEKKEKKASPADETEADLAAQLRARQPTLAAVAREAEAQCLERMRQLMREKAPAVLAAKQPPQPAADAKQKKGAEKKQQESSLAVPAVLEQHCAAEQRRVAAKRVDEIERLRVQVERATLLMMELPQVVFADLRARAQQQAETHATKRLAAFEESCRALRKRHAAHSEQLRPVNNPSAAEIRVLDASESARAEEAAKAAAALRSESEGARQRVGDAFEAAVVHAWETLLHLFDSSLHERDLVAPPGGRPPERHKTFKHLVRLLARKQRAAAGSEGADPAAAASAKKKGKDKDKDKEKPSDAPVSQRFPMAAWRGLLLGSLRDAALAGKEDAPRSPTVICCRTAMNRGVKRARDSALATLRESFAVQRAGEERAATSFSDEERRVAAGWKSRVQNALAAL